MGQKNKIAGLEKQGISKVLIPVILILLGSLAAFNPLMDATLLPRLFFLSLIIGWLIFNKKFEVQFKLNSPAGLLCLFWLYALFNYLFLGQATEGLLELMRIFISWGVFVTALFLFRNFPSFQKLLMPIIGLVTLMHLGVLGYDYFYLVNSEHSANTQLANQLNGLAGHVNLLGSQFFLLFGIAAALWIKGKSKNWKYFSSLLLLIILIAVTIILEVRSATLAFITLGAFFLIVKWLGKKTTAILGLTIVAGLVAMTLIVGATNLDENIIAQYQLYQYDWLQTWIERSRIWSNSFLLWTESPFFGHGLGNWQIEFPKTGLDRIFSATMDQTTFQRPHNDLIWTLCETGIIGFLLQLTIFAYPFYLLYKNKDLQLNTQHILLLGTWLGFLVISCFSFPKERPELMLWSMILLAYIYYLFTNEQIAPNSNLKIGKLKYLALIPCLFFLLIIGSRGTSEISTKKMLISYKNSDLINTVKYAKQAENIFYQIDPTSVPLSWYPGTLQFAANDHQLACNNFEKALKLSPYNFNILNDFGSCQEIAGRREKAIDLYLKALNINPFFEAAKRNLTVVLIKSEQWEAASEWAKKLTDDRMRKEYLQIIKSR